MGWIVGAVGVGAIWWRYGERRIDPQPKADQPDEAEDDEPPVGGR